MKYINQEILKDIPFDQYLNLPGYSYSFLKREVNGTLPAFHSTDKVRIGSIVDDLLTNPEGADVDTELYPIGKKIANFLKDFIGENALETLGRQLSIKGEIENEGLVMPVKGRLDLFGLGRVIDLKVTDVREADLNSLTFYMGYDKQMYNYCNLSGVDQATLIFYTKKTDKIILRNLDFSKGNERCFKFWNEKSLKFGK